MGKILIIIFVGFMLSGCATIDRFYDAAGEAADASYAIKKKSFCRATTIGSLMREYWDGKDFKPEFQNYANICAPYWTSL